MRSTRPTGLSSSSVRRRCSSPACAPAEITLIASSTSTGVLDITRTTGTSAGSRASMNDVGMPAATETTSRPAGITGAISSSSAAMSCGLTARIRVSARCAAATAVAVSTP